MSAPRVQLRRAALALGASTAMVVLLAVVLPRAYLVNDDAGFALYLHKGAYTPFISPLLNRAMLALYGAVPDVPWYGLYLYALIVATGAVLIHMCLELVDERPGPGRIATLLGAMVMIASHVILAVGVTWSTVSISADGTAMIAMIAHAEACRAARRPISRLRAVVYGSLLVAGFTLRQEAIVVTTAALLPLLGWLAVRLVQSRYLPRPTAAIAFLAPIVLAVVVQSRLPPILGAEHNEFNDLRGYVHGASPFGSLDKRAPELLARAGWTVEEYLDFVNWRLVDDSEFPLEKVRRLVDTGGVPTPFTAAEGASVLLGVLDDSPVSVWLFLTSIAGVLALAWLRVIDRRRGIAFGLITLVFLAAVPVAISAFSRFPQRLSLSFYTIGALAIFVFVAREIASRPPGPEVPDTPDRRAPIALAVIALCMFFWARSLFAWADRPAFPYHGALADFADRVNARHGFVMVSVGVTELDPMLVEPFGYDALPSGWGTFSGLWYDYVARFGMKSGAEVLPYMVDNPDAYLVGMAYGHEEFLDWVRRRVHNPSVRLAIVDAAADMPSGVRSELYRMVTTPLVRDSEEWRQLTRDVRARFAELPGPPIATDLSFRSISFAAPYDRYAATLHDAAAHSTVVSLDGGVRCTAGEVPRDTCPVVGAPRYVGIRVPVDGLAAARFDLSLIDPEHVVSCHVYAQTASGRAMRWHWDLARDVQQFGFTGTVTLVADYPGQQFQLTSATATADEIRELHVYVAVEPGTHAGFELRHLEVAEP